MPKKQKKKKEKKAKNPGVVSAALTPEQEKIREFDDEVVAGLDLPNYRPLKILNLGCGPDREAVPLAEALAAHCLEGSTVYSVDITTKLTKKVQTLNGVELRYVRFDASDPEKLATKLGIQDVDVVLMFQPEFGPQSIISVFKMLVHTVPYFLRNGGLMFTACTTGMELDQCHNCYQVAKYETGLQVLVNNEIKTMGRPRTKHPVKLDVTGEGMLRVAGTFTAERFSVFAGAAVLPCSVGDINELGLVARSVVLGQTSLCMKPGFQAALRDLRHSQAVRFSQSRVIILNSSGDYLGAISSRAQSQNETEELAADMARLRPG